MAKKHGKPFPFGAAPAPHHPVHHGHVPQHHGEVPRTHSHGPATQDFHFTAAEEQAMRQGNDGGAPGGDDDGDMD